MYFAKKKKNIFKATDVFPLSTALFFKSRRCRRPRSGREAAPWSSRGPGRWKGQQVSLLNSVTDAFSCETKESVLQHDALATLGILVNKTAPGLGGRGLLGAAWAEHSLAAPPLPGLLSPQVAG